MKFIVVKNVPGVQPSRRHRLKDRFTDFMSLNAKIVKVNLAEGEYSSVTVAYTTLMRAAKKWGFPIKVMKRKDDIYFVRQDI